MRKKEEVTQQYDCIVCEMCMKPMQSVQYVEHMKVHALEYKSEKMEKRLKAAERAVSVARQIQTGPTSWKYFMLAYQAWEKECAV